MKKPKLYLGNLMGPEGNAYVMLGRAQRVAKENNMENWEAIDADATSKDYEHLIEVLDKHFDCEYSRD